VASAYPHVIAARMRTKTEYRAAFAIDVISAAAFSCIDLIVVAVLFSNVSVLGGWSAYEVAFLFGVAQGSFAIADLFFGHLDRLPQLIRTGEFDSVLLQPRRALTTVLTLDIELRRIGSVLVNVVVLAVAWTQVGDRINGADIALVALTIASGAVIFGAIWVIGASSTFWTIDTMEITNTFTYGGRQLTQFPMTIYGTWLRRFVTFVVPLAAVAFFAVRHVLDLEPDGTGWWVRFGGVPAATALWGTAALVWGAALRAYRGTGS
jgi:ABC-2 type transport system permease protein